MQIEQKVLFNELGDDSLTARKIYNGNSTNILNLNNVKYQWAKNLYKQMVENHWIPEKVDIGADLTDYQNLTLVEQDAFKGILSFLIFLDSIQTQNVPRISDYITAPEIVQALSVHAFQESIHAHSYQYLIESIIPIEDREGIYSYSLDCPYLLKRNKYIANTFQEFINNPSEANFVKALIANYILEGIYFYNGFNFFFNLAAKHKMQRTSDMINYIKKDEETHVVLFERILSEVLKEIPTPIEVIHDLFEVAVEFEIGWSQFILGDRILGISNQSSEQYTKYLANKRLLKLGLPTLYEVTINPYSHLENIADTTGKWSKSNFFEATVTNYTQSSSIEGWDF